MAYHWRWLVKRVYKPQLIWWKCFPKDRLGWLLSETQHFPIYVYLQTVTYRWGWLLTEDGLSADFFSECKLRRLVTNQSRGFLPWICGKQNLKRVSLALSARSYRILLLLFISIRITSAYTFLFVTAHSVYELNIYKPQFIWFTTS